MPTRDAPLTATIVQDKDGLKTAYVALRTVARTLEKRAKDQRYSEQQRKAYRHKAWQCGIVANQINPLGLPANAEETFRWDV